MSKPTNLLEFSKLALGRAVGLTLCCGAAALSQQEVSRQEDDAVRGAEPIPLHTKGCVKRVCASHECVLKTNCDN